jgi:hypothetical protein
MVLMISLPCFPYVLLVYLSNAGKESCNGIMMKHSMDLI